MAIQLAVTIRMAGPVRMAPIELVRNVALALTAPSTARRSANNARMATASTPVASVVQRILLPVPPLDNDDRRSHGGKMRTFVAAA